MTTDNEEQAERIIEELLDKRLAACCQQTKVKSTFAWNEKTESSDEILIFIKTFDYLVPLVEKIILSLHSYEIPEIIGYEMMFIQEKYCEWMKSVTLSEDKAVTK